MATLTAIAPREAETEVTVSVIMIFRDAAAFMAEAIESVVSQGFTGWELLLVDDGSQDGGELIAAGYATRMPSQIRVLSHPDRTNQGMSASRNLGLQAARGRYVAFLDADDTWLPQRLQRHIAILERMPAVDMVQSELVHWYSWEEPGQCKDDDYVRPFLRPDDHLLRPPDGLLLAIAVPLYSVGICNITVRRHVLLELGGFEPRFRAAFEDQAALAKIYLHCQTYVLQAHLARYRRHPGSWTRRAKEGRALASAAASARKEFHRWLVDYVDGSGVQDPLLQAQMQALRDAVRDAGVEAALPRRWRTFIRQTVMRLFPAAGKRRLLRWNRRREFRAARDKYRDLCCALQRAGRTDDGGLLGSPVVFASAPVDVSVIMIFHNASRFMDEAVQSVLSQTYRDWELLLVDDGSSDDSTSLARHYADKYPGRIRYMDHPGHVNRGTGPSRNLGLLKARGRYATFLDADDIYLPERLARHAEALVANPRAKLIISKEIYWYQWSRESGSGRARCDEVIGPIADYGTLIDPPVLLRAALTRRGAAMPTPSSITFDRQLALDLGAIPERFVSQYEDQALTAKLMLAAPAVVLEAPLVRYRQHPESLTHRLASSGEYRPGRPHAAYFDYLRWLSEYVAEYVAHFTEFDRVLRRKLWPTRHPTLSRAYEGARSSYRALKGRARR